MNTLKVTNLDGDITIEYLTDRDVVRVKLPFLVIDLDIIVAYLMLYADTYKSGKEDYIKQFCTELVELDMVIYRYTTVSLVINKQMLGLIWSAFQYLSINDVFISTSEKKRIHETICLVEKYGKMIPEIRTEGLFYIPGEEYKSMGANFISKEGEAGNMFDDNMDILPNTAFPNDETRACNTELYGDDGYQERLEAMWNEAELQCIHGKFHQKYKSIKTSK